MFKLIRKMYNFAVSRDILENTPCAGIKIDEIAHIKARDRVLKEAKDNDGVDEITTFWNELEKASMSTEVKNILRLILITGQRPGEVAGIHSREIEGKWWTIPVERRKVKEKSKNPPQPHRVYLSDMAIEILGKFDGYAFPSPANKTDEQGNVIRYTHIDENAVAYAVRRNLKYYQPRRPIKGDKVKMVKVAEERKMDIEHYVPHDLRRTCSTRLAELGYKDELNDAILGHVKTGVVGIYNRYKYDREKQHAMESWERKLKNILTGEKGNVIPFRKAEGSEE
jgi:integrase